MSIHDTVTEGLRENGLRGYEGQARPVVTKLVEREEGIADQIVAAAVAQGLNEADVRAALADTGMHVPTPAAAGGADRDLVARVARLEEELAAAKRRYNF